MMLVSFRSLFRSRPCFALWHGANGRRNARTLTEPHTPNDVNRTVLSFAAVALPVRNSKGLLSRTGDTRVVDA